MQRENNEELNNTAQVLLGQKVIVQSRAKYMAQPAETSLSSMDMQHSLFVWVYEITIQNHSDQVIQLLNRYWRIIDMSGKIEEVRGPGVVGLQPLIKPGKEFVYTSMCQLATPQGTMEGCYEMQDLNDVHFEVVIPKFILSAPKNMVHLFRSRLH